MPDDDQPQGLMEAFGIKASAEHKARTTKSQELTNERVQPNLALIRERVKVIVELMRAEVPMPHSLWDSALQVSLRGRMRELIDKDEAPLTAHEKSLVLQNALDEVFGFGPLGPLLRDPNVGDICINGPQNVYAEQHGRMEKTAIAFENETHLRETIDKIVVPLGLRLDRDNPVAVGQLPNGTRVTATVPPVSVEGATLTLELFRVPLLKLEQLVECGTATAGAAELLRSYIDARANIIVSGGFEAGKTTILNSLLSHIDRCERLITIELQTELRLQHEHWVRLTAQSGGEGGRHENGMQRSVQAAFRMCADRVVLGQCNGVEAYEFLQSLASACAGSMTTVAAPSPVECVRRLTNMIRLAEPNIPMPVAHALIADAVQVIVHVERGKDGRHRITEVVELGGTDEHGVLLVDMLADVETPAPGVEESAEDG